MQFKVEACYSEGAKIGPPFILNLKAPDEQTLKKRLAEKNWVVLAFSKFVQIQDPAIQNNVKRFCAFRKLALYIIPFGGFATTMLMAFLLDKSKLRGVILYLMVVWLVAVGYALVKLGRTQCPNCSRRFFSSFGAASLFNEIICNSCGMTLKGELPQLIESNKK